MSGAQQESAAEWEEVRSRILTVADRITASAPGEPVRLRSVLDVAYEVSGNVAQGVLAGMTAVIPTPYDGETRGEFAVRLRQAVTR